MKLKECFKNPEESEGDELEELLDEEEDMDQQVYIEADNFSDISCDEDENGAEGSESDSDVSFHPDDGSDESVSMSESENDDDKPQTSKTSQNADSNDKEAGCSSKSGKNKTKNGDDGGGSALEYDEDEEDDETVKAMIDAIKKPRNVPPSIELEDFITKVCFHNVLDIVALGTITGDVCLYKYENKGNTHLRNIEIHAKAVRDVQFTVDGRDLLTCSKDKSIMITDMETEKLKKFYETAHDDAINKIYVMDESLFATGDDGGTVKLWDSRCKDPIFSLKEVEDYITNIITNESKKLLLVTSGDGYLTTINVGARKLYVQSEPYEEELTCMGTYRGESKLLVGTSKGRLYSYNWGQFGYHCDMYPGIKTPISEMIPITDRIGCVAGEEGVIRAVHIAPFKNLGVVGQHSMPIESMDVNWSGELIASSSHNNDLRFWSVKYFEDFGEIKYNDKHNNFKERHHNLPSSRVNNTGDFFADLA